MGNRQSHSAESELPPTRSLSKNWKKLKSLINTPLPYTPKETAWIRRNYGCEFVLLTDNGLNIYRRSHRARGRKIARKLIREEEEDSDHDTLEAVKACAFCCEKMRR
ncbi:hypothetical protein Dda_0600 [Drechslerella dactyloides]|uniref:Uncharacterized protein n=1 Tax=Drechslerella dactyloides TaxID=74499 RepID=A0AAD6J6L2_DREDA|nr:hypothetical protein Dda_0600 [Drechslerella dactyloides]